MEEHVIAKSCPPRQITLLEELALLEYFEKQGADYYEARNELYDAHLVVYENCTLFHPTHPSTVLVLLGTEDVEVFAYDTVTSAITLLKKFCAITPDGKAPPAMSGGETI